MNHKKEILWSLRVVTYLFKDLYKEIIIRNPKKREVLKGPGKAPHKT